MARSDELLLHAGDAAVIVFHDGKEIVEAERSREIEGVSKWFTDNRLSVCISTLSLFFFKKVSRRV